MGPLDDFMGSSEPIAALRAQVSRLLTRQHAGGGRLPPILILGETGSGKGLLVRALHQASSRRDRPLVEVNCAAIPDTLVEAELFGFERGAFTDARQAKPGLFQAANGGVLFLDEIGTLPLSAQAKLLTALDQRHVRRLGATRTEAIDAWVLSATNEDLPAAMAEGRFRVDLYHRISPVTLRLPPLRERGRDILALAQHFLARACADYGLSPCRLSTEAQQALLSHAWPGNVRELANLMERVALLSDGTNIAAEMLELPGTLGARREGRGAASLKPERDAVLEALVETQWNLSRAATRLGVPRNTLRYRIERLGIRPADSPARRTVARAMPATAAPTEIEPEPSLRWERRRVAALRVSLALTSEAGAFEATSMVEQLVHKVEHFGAVLDALEPLAFTMLFGLEPMEDAPTRAVMAGQAAMHAVATEPGGAMLTARSAVHVQECLIGRGATVPGMVAEERSRIRAVLEALTSAAAPGATLVSLDTTQFLERTFGLVATPAADGPVGFRVGDRRHTGFEFGGRARSPFVGRDHELALLDDLLTQAENGRGQVVGLVGEPGVGKSRLVYEFQRAIGRERVRYLEGRCVAYGSTTPYLPIAALVREAFGFTDADGPGAIASRLRQGIGALGLDPDAVVPYVLHMLGMKGDATAAPPAPNPEAMRQRTMDALRQVMVAGSERRPTILAVEDLHWIDPTSEASLTILAESVAARRILVLTTYRPGYQPPWLGRSYATQMVLRRLGPADSRSIVEATHPSDGSLPPALADAIVARGDGVPFFLEELARTVPAHVDPRTALAIPETIHDALAARLDRLAGPPRELLQAAAVLGPEGPASILVETAGVDAETFARNFAALRAAELLHDSGGAAAPQYAFSHVLAQEVVYRAMTDERRRPLHAAAAVAIERAAPETAARRPDVLALHYSEAGQLGVAIPHWLRAGQLAIQRSANVEAIAHLTRGLALIDRLPAGADRHRQELALQLALNGAFVARHGYAAPEVEQTLTRVRALADQLGDAMELVPVRFGLWRFYASRADFPAAQALAERILAAAALPEGAHALVPGHSALAVTAFYSGRFPDARHHMLEVLRLHDPARSAIEAALYSQDLGPAMRGFLGWTQTLMGEIGAGVEAAERAVEEARAGGHAFTLAVTLMTAGLVRGERREAAPTRRHGEDLRAVSDQQGFELFAAFGAYLVGYGEFLAGELDRGASLMREGYERYHAAQQRVGLRFRAMFAEVLIEAGHVDDGLTAAEALILHSERTGEGGSLSEVYRVKGLGRWRQGAANTEIDALLTRAVDIAQAQDARLLALRAASSLARFHRERGLAPTALPRLRNLLAGFDENLALPDLIAAADLLRGPTA